MGKNLPKSILPTKPYCLISSRLLWLGVLSIDPKPIVDIFPENEIFPRSAKFASMDPNAAQPPLPSISESLSSLNHTSPESKSPGTKEGFLTPIIKLFILPTDGFPLIANLYFLFPGKDEIDSNSSIMTKFSSKYTVLVELTLPSRVNAFSFVNFSNKKSIEFESGSHTASPESLLDVLWL